MSESSTSGIQVIARAALILREVAANPVAMSLGQLAAATGLARSTVQRIVYALEAEHLVQAGPGGVRPGWSLRQLGNQAGPEVLSRIRPHLYRLYEDTGDTVDVSTLWDGEVLFLDRFLSSKPTRSSLTGQRFPAYAMANGKALLATLSDVHVDALYGRSAFDGLTSKTLASINELTEELRRIRAGAFAYDVEEHAAGECAIGLSIGRSKAIPFAISVVMPAEGFDVRRTLVECALQQCVKSCRQLMD